MKRRSFLKKTTAAGLAVGVPAAIEAPAILSTRSPNAQMVVAAIGVNSRGGAVAASFARTENVEVGFIADVDKKAIAKGIKSVTGHQDRTPEGVQDFRTLLENPDIDAVLIATPDHWQAPAAIMAMQAGKHVYVEKPGSHNPAEGKMLVEAEKKYNRVITLGTQQRSDPRSIEVINHMREGMIGEVYFGKAFYSNTRGPIGHGKPAEVPADLDYELWQGPAPRQPYRDNLIHYNWHWFRNYGTGEALNNGTHEVDVCRWALGVDFPTRVVSTGGRFHYKDDWEFYDTQIMSFEFEGGKSLSWEGRSCNGHQFFGRGRGAVLHGTEGTVLMDRDGYIMYDLDNKEIKRNMKGEASDQLNTTGGGDMTDTHVANFCSAVMNTTPLTQSNASGQTSVLLCHLGNIAQTTGRALYCNPANGEIIGDNEAAKLWSRTYEPGWAPTI